MEVELLASKFDKSRNIKHVIQGVFGFEVVDSKRIAEIHITRGVRGLQGCVCVSVCVLGG